MVKVIKKDLREVDFNPEKIINAVEKSAERIGIKLPKDRIEKVIDIIIETIDELNLKTINVSELHDLVEKSLFKVNKDVANSYMSYRNYKKDFVSMLDTVYQDRISIMFRGDKENSNADSSLISTKRCLTLNTLNKEMYKKFQLTGHELEALETGFIYIHDQSARLDTFNCCLFDLGSVLTGGFESGNIFYNEPKTLDTAFDVMGDIILSAASQQYGGFSVPEIDKILAPYVKKSYNYHRDFYLDINPKNTEEDAFTYAEKMVHRELRQGFQGLEIKFNSVASSRGDYPFILFSFGLGETPEEQLISEYCLKVRMKGQGKPGYEIPVLFPKLVFLYDKEKHGIGKPLRHIFELAIECSSKAMYPDFLSLTGDGYVADMYKKYKEVITPMGCRAFLSPWYIEGGIEPKDENDRPVYLGRFNIGAISLNLPLIYMSALKENPKNIKSEFYKKLDYFLEMIRQRHLKTYEYLGKLKASSNPLAFCEGGLYGGHLKPNETIEPLLKSATASFGITGLHEFTKLVTENHNGIKDNTEPAEKVMEYINKKVNEYKQQDKKLYAIYGTPAESLCGQQAKQFKTFCGTDTPLGDIKYYTNSFHCHVSEDISPIEKQNLEKRFWNYFNGGKIQYVKYPVAYNLDAITTLVERAMEEGFYEGVNLELSYCNSCGHSGIGEDICKNCGSKDLTKIDRMNGYLSYSRVKGESRLNDAKMLEIADRVSM